MMPDSPSSAWPDPDALGTATDLYQLTMMAGYAASGLDGERATFELFVRKLPPGRSYLVFAGLEQAVAALLDLRFSPEQVKALRSWPVFAGIDPSWFDSLLDFRFRGDIWAMPEGTVAFAGEPLVRVEASLSQGQLAETLLISLLGYPTSVASKAARIVAAAEGRAVVDLGTRRGHGPQAGFLNARSSYLAGFAGTSHVESSIRLGIPCFGTMAHSWVQAFGDEEQAFSTFARLYPDASTLLVDTYDTDEGVRRAARVEPPVRAIRIDSGDLAAAARSARSILDGMGRGAVRILASNDLDEHKIAALGAEGAPIDSYGVGTELITVRDAPAIAMVYKLVEIGGAGRIKRASGKRTYPFGKQIFRVRDADGRIAGDRVSRADETGDGEPLLSRIVREGRMEAPWPSLEAIRDRCRDQVAALPAGLRQLDGGGYYPVVYSGLLEREAIRLGMDQGVPEDTGS